MKLLDSIIEFWMEGLGKIHKRICFQLGLVDGTRDVGNRIRVFVEIQIVELHMYTT